MSAARPWAPAPDGLRIRLRATPRARRNAVGEISELPDGPALKVAVTAPPADGAANAAVMKLVAKTLGIAKSALTLESGASGRSKTVHIAGDAATLTPMLEALADGAKAAAKGSKRP